MVGPQISRDELQKKINSLSGSRGGHYLAWDIFSFVESCYRVFVILEVVTEICPDECLGACSGTGHHWVDGIFKTPHAIGQFLEVDVHKTMLFSTSASVIISSLALDLHTNPEIDFVDVKRFDSLPANNFGAVAKEGDKQRGRIVDHILIAVLIWAFQRNVRLSPLGVHRGRTLFWVF